MSINSNARAVFVDDVDRLKKNRASTDLFSSKKNRRGAVPNLRMRGCGVKCVIKGLLMTPFLNIKHPLIVV